MMVRIFRFFLSISPSAKRFGIRIWYQLLARKYRLESWTFMNYGFAPLDTFVEKLSLRPEQEKDRHCIQLYQHVAGAVDIEGKAVLEIGSGRGGGSDYIARNLNPGSMVGMDISEEAVALCNQFFQVSNLEFHAGDAEALPFESDSFDVVINVESSHGYGSMENFLTEVYRVLKPGGYFSWADLRDTKVIDDLEKSFQSTDFRVVTEQDITNNVLQSMDHESDAKEQAIEKVVPRYIRKSFKDFAGIRGTRVFNAFQSKDSIYLSKVLQKPAIQAAA